MMPRPTRPTEPSPNYRVPLAGEAPADDEGRELAMAWAGLAALRGSPIAGRRVTVLRPFALSSGA
jgi:hypothetical protein